MKTEPYPSVESAFFSEMDKTPYTGQWVAISGKNLIAHGFNAKDVYERTKKEITPNASLFMVKVFDNTDLYFLQKHLFTDNKTRVDVKH